VGGEVEQKKIVLYSKDWCSYSWRAKRLLRSKGYDFEVVDATGDEELRAWLAKATGRGTVPQIFIDETPVGGYDDIKALERSGELGRLVGSA
jgi:glutaredoxin 3